MLKSILIYSGILSIMLFFSYQSSIKEESVDEGSVIWFQTDVSHIKKIIYADKDREVTLTPLSGSNQFWLKYKGIENKKAKLSLEKIKAKKNGTTFDPNQVEYNREVFEFKVNDTIEYFLDFVSKMKAIRVIGDLDQLDPKEYGLENDGSGVFVVQTSTDKSLKLKLGSSSLGSSNIYALDLKRQKVILISNFQISKLKNPKLKLFESKPISLDFDSLKSVGLKTSDGTSNKWFLKDISSNATKVWTNSLKPGIKDSKVETLMYALRRLSIESYSSMAERSGIESLPLIAEVTFDEGLPSEHLLIIRKDSSSHQQNVYWLKSNFTSEYAKVISGFGEKFEEALKAVLPQ